METLTLVHDTVIIDEPTQSEAAALVHAAGDLSMDGFVVMIDGKPHEVPAGLTKVILHVIERAGEGGALTVKTMPDELTTTVAADMLGVSRPTLMKLIASGEISAREVGSHKRLRAQDVLAFRAKRLTAQREAFGRLRGMNV